MIAQKQTFQDVSPPRAGRIAIVGSGPSGLSAAYYLACAGYKVIVFEAEEEVGGMLRYGIPEYRLPKTLLRQDIEDLLGLGIDICTRAYIDDLDVLQKEGFDAIILALGCQEGKKISIRGLEDKELLTGLEFMRAINKGKQLEVGKRAAVIGGGNVAIDCARTLVRLGSTVYVICLESPQEIPASKEEVQQALEEGVNFKWSTGINRVTENKDGTKKLALAKVLHLQIDSNRVIDAKLAEEHFEYLDVDFILLAIGLIPKVPLKYQVDIDSYGRIKITPYNFMTKHRGIFATGDVVTCPSNIVQAIGSGKACALAVYRSLGGKDDLIERLSPPVFPYFGKIHNFASFARFEPPLVDARVRIQGMSSVLSAWEPSRAVYEANRCLRCYLRLNIRKPRLWTE